MMHADSVIIGHSPVPRSRLQC
jgi:hypothetical protein